MDSKQFQEIVVYGVVGALALGAGVYVAEGIKEWIKFRKFNNHILNLTRKTNETLKEVNTKLEQTIEQEELARKRLAKISQREYEDASLDYF